MLRKLSLEREQHPQEKTSITLAPIIVAVSDNCVELRPNHARSIFAGSFITKKNIKHPCTLNKLLESVLSSLGQRPEAVVARRES